MAELNLLNGEKVLMSSDKDVLILTNYRVRLNETAAGKSKYASISLDAIASCGVMTKSTPILLGLAALCFTIGVISSISNSSIHDLAFGLFIITAVLIVIYFIFRSAVIAITSVGGDRITSPVKGMSRENILQFIESVEEARFKFLGKI